MGTDSLGSMIEDMFKVKGYGIVRSSPENRLLIAKKGEEVLSIGYSDLDAPTTMGEGEMFISISESEGATGMLFISPARIHRDVLGLLRGKGVQVWDRTSLVLAIGENELKKASLEEMEEWDPEDVPPPEKPLFTEQRDIDPLSELRKSEREVTGKETAFRVTRIGERAMCDEAPPPQGTTNGPRPRAFPEKPPEEGKEAISPPPVEVPKVRSPEAVRDRRPSIGLEPYPFPRDLGWNIAPLRIGKEEAMSMAPGSLKGLELVYRPYLLMDLSCRIRSIDGEEEADKSVALMIDLIDRSVTDIPSATVSDISWAEAMEPGSKLEDEGAVDLEEGRRAGADSLRFRDHAMERKVHDGMMSTIYKEMESNVVQGSIRASSEVQVHMPVWKGRLTFGDMTWLMDGYTGTQRRTR